MTADQLDDPTASVRDGMKRAELARMAGDQLGSGRLIEEFLFLGNATVSLLNQFGGDMGTSMLARVLVIHDEESVVTMMRECLVSHGETFHLEQVPHGRVGAALDLLDEQRPHLILIASSLRLSEGLGAMHLIRHHPRGSELPILVLSHDPRRTDGLLALAAGATAFLPMPDNLSDYPRLADKMREMLLDDEQSRRQQA